MLKCAAQDPSIKLPLMVGPRYDALTAALTKMEGAAKALAALKAFRQYDTLRNYLTHGTARVALERDGAWLAAMTMIIFRPSKVERPVMVVDQESIVALAKDLHADMQRLAAHLRTLGDKA